MIGVFKHPDCEKPRKINKKNFFDFAMHQSKKNNKLNINGNFKVHTNRISLPPNFISRGVAFTKAVANEDNSEVNISDNDIFSYEGLGCNNINPETNIEKIRRSDRLKKAASKKGTGFALNSNRIKPIVAEKNNYIPRRKKSKSVFQEINESYEIYKKNLNKQQKQNLQDLSGKPSTDLTNFIDSFSDKFASEVKIKFKNDPLETCIRNIVQFSENINMDLNVPSKDEEMQEKVKNEKKSSGELQLIPKCKWVYNTPPKQRIASAKLAESTIKPGVICSVDKNRNFLYAITTPNISFDTNVNTLSEDVLRHEATFGEMTSKFHTTDSAPLNALPFKKANILPMGTKRKFAFLQPITEEKTTQTEFRDPELDEQEANSEEFNPIIEQPTRTKKRCNSRIVDFFKSKKNDVFFKNLPSSSKFVEDNAATTFNSSLFIPSPSGINPMRGKNPLLLRRNIFQDLATNEKRHKKRFDEGDTSSFFNCSNKK